MRFEAEVIAEMANVIEQYAQQCFRQIRQGEEKRTNEVGKQGNKGCSNDVERSKTEISIFLAGFREIAIWWKKT